MKKVLYNKNNLNIIGVFCEEDIIDIRSIISANNDKVENYEILETDKDTFQLIKDESGIVSAIEVNEEISTEQQRKNILNQLSQLDLIVPRIVEDIISQGNFTIHQSKLNIISQKEFLRQQLIELEV